MFGMDRTKDQGRRSFSGGPAGGSDRQPGRTACQPHSARPIAHAEVARARRQRRAGPRSGAWQFRIAGLVGKPVSWTWEEFLKLPRVKVFSDFHCVTRWSRLGISGKAFQHGNWCGSREAPMPGRGS